jgi:hypothetical protein
LDLKGVAEMFTPFFIGNSKSLYICLMKFGVSQIWKQSPLVISRLKRAINFFTFSVVAFTPVLCRWIGISETDLITGLGFFGLMVNTVGIMFGVDPETIENPNE